MCEIKKGINISLIFLSVMAACAIANIVKSSLGPVGLDKMLVDDIGVCITNFLIFFIVCIYILNIKIFRTKCHNFLRMLLLPMMVQPFCVCWKLNILLREFWLN